MTDALYIAIIIVAVLAAVLIVFAVVMWLVNNREERQLKKNTPHYRHDVIISGGVDVVTGQMRKNDHQYFNGMGDYKFETLCLSGDLTPGISRRIGHSLLLVNQSSGEQYNCSFISEVIIGRSPAPNVSSVITIKNDNSVSGNHCRLFERGGAFYIEDLGSSNHTYLNRNILTTPLPVKNGDFLKIGKSSYQVILN